ncbi:hypothetical protein B0A49_07170 [Cryomyces minteri]|uniref:DUF4419 domain-containing protein n=1 Tax=Cryomyces minteri TaxID=331657 RepID=A0A4V5NI95_9PEZI|nr:hypothetical protein B0A49_07170 [Cryomyces minteri]
MPVTIYPAPHGANVVKTEAYSAKLISDPLGLLNASCERESHKCAHLIQSSFADLPERKIMSSTNGFVKGAVRAYSEHHHLTIRPDDVWITILNQLSLYVNAHAEELRSMFVAHEGKKELRVDVVAPNRFCADFAWVAAAMTGLMEKSIKDPSLRSWIMQEFSTTTHADRAVAAMTMMATLQQYFDFRCRIMCGIPSVTLLGGKEDWKLLLTAIDRLPSFGEQPAEWHRTLKPVISRFVDTFDTSSHGILASKYFWQHIAHYSGGGSGPTYLSGWITAFCFWDGEGKCLRSNRNAYPVEHSYGSPTPELYLDGVRYHRLEREDVPVGYCSVPMHLNDHGEELRTLMVAGSVGLSVSSSGQELHSGGKGLDSLQPEVGWWLFEAHDFGEYEEGQHTLFQHNEKDIETNTKALRLTNGDAYTAYKYLQDWKKGKHD